MKISNTCVVARFIGRINCLINQATTIWQSKLCHYICVALASICLLIPTSSFAAPATPVMSDPIQMEAEDGTTVMPMSLTFFSHPLTGTANFNPNNYKVKIKDANGQEQEFDVQDLLVMFASTTAKDCSYGSDELVQVVKTIFTNLFSNIGPGVFDLPEGTKLDEFSEKMALVYALTICPSKIILIQQSIPSLIGHIEKAAVSTPANPAEITEAEKAAFLNTIDSLKVITDTGKAVDIFKQLLTNLEDENVLPNGYAGPILAILDQMTSEKKPVNELLLADIRDEGGEPVNTAQHLNPYEKGFPFTFKNLLTTPVYNNGELMGFAGVMYDNFVTPTVQIEPSIGNISPHIVFYQWKEALKLSAIGGGILTNKVKCNPIKSEQNGVQTFWTVEEMISKGCWSENEPTGTVSLDFNNDGLGDLVIINRGNLPNDEDHAYATFYAGKKDVSEGELPFEYGVMEKIELEPYDVKVIDGNNVIITANKPDSQGVYKLSKVGFSNNVFFNQSIPVATPANDFGPYQITAVDLGGECQGFAFTSAKIDAGEAGKPETASIIFTNKFTVYRGEKGDSGMCDKYTLVGHYSAPQKVAGEGDVINDPALLAAITFAPVNEEKGLPAGLWLGDQYIYTNADDDKIAYAYYFPIYVAQDFSPANKGEINTIDAVKYRVSKAMDYLEEDLPGGGVKQLRIDAYGNLGVALGYPKVWQEIPAIVPPPPPEACGICIPNGTSANYAGYSNPCVGSNGEMTTGFAANGGDPDGDGVPDLCVSKPPLPACGICQAHGTAAKYVGYSESCVGIDGKETTGFIANGGDADDDKVPDNCDSCKPGVDTCFGPAGHDPCYNPDQKKVGVCEKPPSPCDKGTPIKGVFYKGQQCYTNDLDCDGAADTPAVCDNCPPTSKNPVCYGNYWGTTIKPCNPNSPTESCKNRILEGVPPAADPCIGTSNSDQNDFDGDGTGDACEVLLFNYQPPNDIIKRIPEPVAKECVKYYKCGGTDSAGDPKFFTVKVPYEKCGYNDTDCDGQADWFMGCNKLLQPACDSCPPPPAFAPYNSTTYPPYATSDCSGGPAQNVGCPADQPCCNPNFESICAKLPNPCGNTDTDGDGINNKCDDCPFVSDPLQTDENPDDGIGDECAAKDKNGNWSLDTDGDGKANESDNCPFVQNVESNGEQLDADNDGIGDKCDTCPTIKLGETDESGNDKCGNVDTKCSNAFKLTGVDSDGDGIDDACDDNSLLTDYSGYWKEWQAEITKLEDIGKELTDIDGDQLFPDLCECFYSTDPNALVKVTMTQMTTDVLSKGIWSEWDGKDNIVLPPYDYVSVTHPNPDIDACKAKCESANVNCTGVWPGSLTCDEICPPPKEGEFSWGDDPCKVNCEKCEKCKNDCDKLGPEVRKYICGDPDGDKICSQKLAANDKVTFQGTQLADLDNCPFVPNPSQKDGDNDGIGNACNGDIDGDTVLDGIDNCPFMSNKNQADTDADGAGNVCDTISTSNTGIGSKTCFQYAVALDACWSKCPKIKSNSDNFNTFKLSGVDSDADGVDDACDQYNFPKKHFYWKSWKQRLQQKGFDTSKMGGISSTKEYDLNLISKAYAGEGDVKKVLTSAGAVTVLINKGASAVACGECLPSGTAEDYAKFTPECVEQLGGDTKPHDGIPDTCSTGISGLGECFVDIGRDGKQAAGIGELNSSYDTHVRGMNDRGREMVYKAALVKDQKTKFADIRRDIFIGELGYYHITCAVGRETPPPAGTTPGWALFQLGGIPLDPKYFAKDNYRPSFPPPTIEIQQAGKAAVTISRDDFLKNSATRLVGTLDTPATAQKGIVPNVAALDFALPSIVTDKIQLAMPDTNAFAQNITVGGLNSILVDLGAEKSDPLMRVIVTPLPESGKVSQLSISPYLSSQFQPGQMIQVDIEGYAGVDAASFVHPDLAKPYVKLDPNIIFNTLAEVLNNMIQDPAVTKIEYTNVMNALNESLKAKGANWDPTGYLNMRLLPTMGVSKTASSQPEVYMYIVPLSSLPASGAGGCGRCSLNGREAFGTGNVAIIVLIGLAIFAPIVWRRRRVM